MRAAVIGVVEQEGVAGLEPAVTGDFVDHRLDRERHGADEDRQACRSLHQRRAGFGMVEAVAGVARLGDDRIESGAVERRVHFVGDLLEPALEDRQRDGIERAHRAAPARTRTASRSLQVPGFVALAEREHLRSSDDGVQRIEIEHAVAEGVASCRRASESS